MRMLMNNLDPEVAERPEDLVVYGGTGRAARSWEAFDAIVRTLRTLGDDETLLVQSGKPVAVFRTHDMAPRVLISNSMLVPKWADWETFRALEAQGLTMYGQMTAGSWIYIGTQGILQGTYETLAECAHQHFGGSLAGTVTLTGGLGGMGGAQPLAVTMNDGVALCVEVDPARIERRVKTRYLDRETDDLDTALRWADDARAAREAVSIGLVGNCAEVLPELRSRGWQPDIVTDQTSAHDPLGGYVPAGLSLDEAAALRARDPQDYVRRAEASMAAHVEAIVGFAAGGAVAFDYGNNLRAGAEPAGSRTTSPPATRGSCRRSCARSSARARARSGGRRCRATRPTSPPPTPRSPSSSPRTSGCSEWLRLAAERVAFQGLPARICWLGYGERDRAGERFNELVASGAVAAPIVIGRDHLDAGSVASPNRETEAMLDGSDAIADWPILNALVNTAAGAHWVSVHHGGGVGIGYSIHAGMVVVADGTRERRRAPPARADDRPRHGGGAPRRRGLRPRDRGRRRARGAHADAGGRVSGSHIVAMGGGQWPDDPIYRFIFDLTGAPRPKVLFVPTAVGDADRAVAAFYRSFPAHSFEPSDLALFHRTVEDLRSFVLTQDAVFVSGGNTLNLLAIWRAHGLDEILREAWDAGVVLAGGSAGANCWFEASTTDSFLLGRADPLPDGLGLVPGSFCPHFDSEPARRPSSTASSGKACCRPASRATTWRPCTWWAPRWPRCSSPMRARAPAGSSRARRATSSRCRSRPACSGATRERAGRGAARGRRRGRRRRRRAGGVRRRARAPGSRRRGRSSTRPWRAARRSTASRPGSARSPTPGSSRRRPPRCSTASCARTPRPSGAPLSREEARAMLLLRAHVLALGHSGVRPAVVDLMVSMLNEDVIPAVPQQGSLGASGDLAPLANLALPLIGHGGVLTPEGGVEPAAAAMARAGLDRSRSRRRRASPS